MISLLHRNRWTSKWKSSRRKSNKNAKNCNVEIAISRSKKEFWKNSSLVTHNAVSCCDIEDCSADSPYVTRHPTHHQNLCILLIIWILHAQFTLSPLVTLKMGDEWIGSVSCSVLKWYAMWWWWVGDEWSEMNHRCNIKSHSNLQRYGWRVDE